MKKEIIRLVVFASACSHRPSREHSLRNVNVAYLLFSIGTEKRENRGDGKERETEAGRQSDRVKQGENDLEKANTKRSRITGV